MTPQPTDADRKVARAMLWERDPSEASVEPAAERIAEIRASAYAQGRAEAVNEARELLMAASDEQEKDGDHAGFIALRAGALIVCSLAPAIRAAQEGASDV